MDATARGSIAPRPARRTGAGCLGTVFNLLTVILVVLTCVVGAGVAVLFQFPDVLRFIPGGSAYIPPTAPAVAQVLPLATLAVIAPGASPTLSPDDAVFPTLPPEWTPVDTPTVTHTPLPRTETVVPTETPARATRTPTNTNTPEFTPTRTPTPTRTGPPPTATNTRSPQAYTLQTGSPTYLANFLNNAGCNWFGFTGQVFALDGRVVIGLVIKARAGDIDLPQVVTGSASAFPGGYEVYLNDHPIAATDVYKIQLFNNTGTALSEQYTIPTFGDCTRNVVMVNFVQNH